MDVSKDIERIRKKLDGVRKEWKLTLVSFLLTGIFWHYVFGLELLFIGKMFIAWISILALGFFITRLRI